MNVIANTKHMERSEWLALRNKGIGGSDAAVVAGLNKYKSPFTLYLEKTGRVVSDEIYITDEDGAFLSGSEAAYFGNANEEKVAAEFTLRSKLKVRRDNRMMAHPKYPWMIANIDRRVVGTNEILECKTASEYLKGEWEGEELPQQYYIQGMHYLAVTGAKAVWFAVLIGGNKFVYKRIERDEEVIDHLIAIEKDFWENHVMTGFAPAIDGSDASTDFLSNMFRGEPGSEMELDDAADELIGELEEAKESKKKIDELVKTYENRLKQMMGDMETGQASDHIVTWKSTISNRVDSKLLKTEYPDVYEAVIKPSVSRRFGIKKIKGAK